MQSYARVAIDSPVQALDRPFDYEIPQRMLGVVEVGSVVRVNLHGRNMRAFVVELLEEPAVADPRALSALVSREPLFTPDAVALAEWTARRYVVPLGLVLHDAVPGRFSAPSAHDAADRRPQPQITKPSWLTGDLSTLLQADGEACVVLPSSALEPELVAYAVSEVRARGRSSLVICPRVEVVETIGSVVPGSVVLHGDDRPTDRAAAWAAARDGTADVVVGGRSALFVPMRNLGLVAVVSAHDRSLRAERTPRLHALHVARRRAQMHACAFVASSPAPPPEIAAGEGVTTIAAKRPAVRPETSRPRKGPVTPRLLDTVRWAIDRGSDALVFVGRRGDVLRLRCADCGWVPSCPSCGTGLALDRPVLRCRVCGTSADAPEACELCGGSLSERGWGHERVARVIEKELGVRVVRIVAGAEDVDRPSPSVVVGTLAAAHGGPSFEAVCVADLDQLLSRPDFRAGEFALQALHELAGVLAAGGRFLVQTREPEHHVVQAFTRGSYRYFLERELVYRKETGYPPFGAVVRLSVENEFLDELGEHLAGTSARIVGAIPKRARVAVLVRGPDLEPMLDPLRRFVAAHPRTKVDVDPVDLS